MLSGNPIVLTTVDQEYKTNCRIIAFVWEGATTAADVAEVVGRSAGGPLLWAGRTPDTQTYQGVSLGPYGITAPRGFRCSKLSAGRVLVYLRED
jgi:hypothetical protein